MNVDCPQCSTRYRVDPARVPEGGVDTSCSECAEVFRVSRPPVLETPVGGGQEAGSTAAAMATKSPAPADAPAAQEEPEPGASPEVREEEPVVAQAADEVVEAAAEDEAATAPAGGEAQARTGGGASDALAAFSMRSQEPEDRARRIARALVSDIVAYHPDRRERALANGTLRTEFRDEIIKSWVEFVQQVGEEVANRTPHFRDALNDVLAKGQKVF